MKVKLRIHHRILLQQFQKLAFMLQLDRRVVRLLYQELLVLEVVFVEFLRLA